MDKYNEYVDLYFNAESSKTQTLGECKSCLETEIININKMCKDCQDEEFKS
jgi:hypothetical protein